MIYGYARVSTLGQAKDGNSLEYQVRELKAAGAQVIFRESYTGTKLHRPEMDKLMAQVKEGDTVIITKLDRIARSTKHGIELVESFVERGCTLNILNMGVFNNTPTGKLMLQVMLAFAEFERNMIVQRTTEGKEIRRQDPDFHEGHPFAEYDHELFESLKASGRPASECWKELGVSRSTWYRILKRTA